MNTEELGLIFLKLQEDDVRIPEMRAFYDALVTREDMRRNAALVGRLCTLSEEERYSYAKAGLTVILASFDIRPTGPPGDISTFVEVSSSKAPSVLKLSQGNWKEHIKTNQKRALVSEELKQVIIALQNLWQVPGRLL
jgi:C1A family cysteine protease